MESEDEKWDEVAIVEEGFYDVEVTHVEHDQLPSTHHLYGKIIAGPLAGQKVKLGVLFIDKPDFFKQDPTHFDDDAVTALTGGSSG